MNKAGQSAREIIDEVVEETVVALRGAGSFLNSSSKL